MAKMACLKGKNKNFNDFFLFLQGWKQYSDKVDVLHIEVDDIYFLTRLSHRGLEMTLSGIVSRNALSIRDYTWEYYGPNT